MASISLITHKSVCVTRISLAHFANLWEWAVTRVRGQDVVKWRAMLKYAFGAPLLEGRDPPLRPMADFFLRSAVETDAPKIRDLIHRVDINRLGLNWRRFVVVETRDGKFIGCAQLKPHGDGSLELNRTAKRLQ